MATPAPLPGPERRLAYAFYATDDAYAVAVLVFVRLLRERGVREDIDFVVLHHSLSPGLVQAIAQGGISPRPVPPLGGTFTSPLRRARSSYFRHSLTKLRVFALTEYDRVVFADADALPLKSLDHLFELPMPAAIAAAPAYWPVRQRWTSALMVVEPSAGGWSRVSGHLGRARWRPDHDMDIVNAEFEGEIHSLGPEIFCLNSEWEDKRRQGHFADPLDALARVSVVHFTALGKPWSYPAHEVRRLRPNAHPAFYELWERWRRAREDVLGRNGRARAA
jgi:hypothetical protein